ITEENAALKVAVMEKYDVKQSRGFYDYSQHPKEAKIRAEIEEINKHTFDLGNIKIISFEELAEATPEANSAILAVLMKRIVKDYPMKVSLNDLVQMLAARAGQPFDLPLQEQLKVILNYK